MASLSPAQITTLRQYKYVSMDASPLDQYIMKPYWDFMVTLLPLTMAPNLVTLIGFVQHILVVCLFGYACTQLDHMPAHMFYLMAVSIFIYQTLDAIDGKQARRTGSSSPLGQMFDHGCDAMVTSFMAASVIIAARGGGTMFAVTAFHLGLIPFFVHNWEECQTGVMNFQMFGVTESQMALIVIHTVAGYFGQEVIVAYRNYLVMTIAVTVVTSVWSCVRNVVRYFAARRQQHAQVRQAKQQMVLFLAVTAADVLWYVLMLRRYPVEDMPIFAYMAMAGVQMAYFVNWLMLTRLTGCETRVGYTLCGLPFMCVHAAWPSMFAAVSPVVSWQVYTLFMLVYYLRFVVVTVRNIAAGLDIWILTIKPRDDNNKDH